MAEAGAVLGGRQDGLLESEIGHVEDTPRAAADRPEHAALQVELEAAKFAADRTPQVAGSSGAGSAEAGAAAAAAMDAMEQAGSASAQTAAAAAEDRAGAAGLPAEPNGEVAFNHKPGSDPPASAATAAEPQLTEAEGAWRTLWQRLEAKGWACVHLGERQQEECFLLPPGEAACLTDGASVTAEDGSVRAMYYTRREVQMHLQIVARGAEAIEQQSQRRAFWNDKTLATLQNACREQGLYPGGDTSDLRERLLAWEFDADLLTEDDTRTEEEAVAQSRGAALVAASRCAGMSITSTGGAGGGGGGGGVAAAAAAAQHGHAVADMEMGLVYSQQPGAGGAALPQAEGLCSAGGAGARSRTEHEVRQGLSQAPRPFSLRRFLTQNCILSFAKTGPGETQG
jgi:hypothetical protein